MSDTDDDFTLPELKVYIIVKVYFENLCFIVRKEDVI